MMDDRLIPIDQYVKKIMTAISDAEWVGDHDSVKMLEDELEHVLLVAEGSKFMAKF